MNTAEKQDMSAVENKKWVEVVALDDIPALGSRVIETDTVEIAVFRTANDEVFAIKNACPHKGGPLSEGIVHGTTVTCPLHNWKINLIDGIALAPDEGCSNIFTVKVENGLVFIEL